MSDEESGIKMRYSREKRLARASDDVKALYERRTGKKKGFLSFIKGNRNLSMLFITVVAFALMALAYPFLMGQKNGKKLGAYRIAALANYKDGEVLVSLNLNAASRGRKAANQTLLVRTSTNGTLFSAREFALSGSAEEVFFFRLPVDSRPAALECLFSIGDSQINVNLPIKDAN
jgi:hypothetical protein